jgi:hypothetical protein
MLLVVGGALVVVGLLLVLSERFPWLRIGRLPLDVSIEREGFHLYIPLGTSILVSVALSLVLWLLSRRG